MIKKLHISLLLCFFCSFLLAQTFSISGTITEGKGKTAMPFVNIFLEGTDYACSSDENGNFYFNELKPGIYQLQATFIGYQTITKDITLKDKDLFYAIKMVPKTEMIDEVLIEEKGSEYFGMSHLRGVELNDMAIYASKKTEVILLANTDANVANNISRQIYNRVPGLNVWESDGAGLQLGIGARGLSPKRTANFNTRQNGYDIAADALGYPESYYTPPAEALEEIQIIRGAASLQYGTQFGGMINFVFKKPPEDKPLEILTRQTYGSWNFYNNFTSLAGTHKKLSYYTFYQFKRGDGWRPNSEFKDHMYFGSLTYKANDKLKFGIEHTHMNYLAQQAGGLTDLQFEIDPRQSFRARNWFTVNWNLLSLNMDYVFSEQNKLNIRTFGNYSSKEALGKLDKIYEADIEGENRELLQDEYRNFGIEIRDIQRYNVAGNTASLLIGARYFQGQTNQRQGDADNTGDPNFAFLNPDFLEGSDFRFPERNVAVFAENMFNFGPRFTVTPGIRFEYIETHAEGYYTTITTDFNGNEIARMQTDELKDRFRSFVLLGIGASYKPNADVELYANFSENYRSITFSDIRVTNINFAVDPNIQDERGWNADLGARGTWEDKINYDVSLFAMRYNDRIGHVWDTDVSTIGNQVLVKKIRKNIGKAQTYGLEAFAEFNIWKGFVRPNAQFNWTAFANLSLTHARYISSIQTADGSSFEGNKVELVSPMMLRTGSSVHYKDAKLSLQYSFTGKQFTDASNEDGVVSTAVIGPIPAYHIVDLSTSYSFKMLRIEAGINNLLDNMYFTRRAEAYPGPGIIPSDGRSFYLTLQLKIDQFRKQQ